MKKFLVALMAVLMVVMPIFAQGSKEEAVKVEDTEILVAAAASLRYAYEDELIPMFESQNPSVKIVGTYDSSGKLQKQIEAGLEADVFMSASPKQMNALIGEELIAADTKVDLLENRIVLIVPAGNEFGLREFSDINNVNAIALGDPRSVPVGQYSQEALTSLGLWDAIQDKLSLGTNVTEVLNQVAAGSADAGIVYMTDAMQKKGEIDVIAEAPAGSLSKKVIYPVAVTAGTSHKAEAQAFVDFLQSPEAMEVFVKYGFASNV